MMVIEITTDMIRLGQMLKVCGIAENGGAAKAMILDGLVTVNGEVTLQRGKQIVPGDIVRVMDEEILVQRETV
ncbi:MAG: RNA-binding S4 domain-containing protein [Ruminococcaceae bacterium]|nr:RNA-binding S4 domain-containing protein [Oscillospiraceae bacterium]